MGYYFKVDNEKWWDEKTISEYVGDAERLFSDSGYDRRGHEERTDVYEIDGLSVVVKTKFGILTCNGFENLCAVRKYRRLPKKYSRGRGRNAA